MAQLNETSQTQVYFDLTSVELELIILAIIVKIRIENYIEFFKNYESNSFKPIHKQFTAYSELAKLMQ